MSGKTDLPARAPRRRRPRPPFLDLYRPDAAGSGQQESGHHGGQDFTLFGLRMDDRLALSAGAPGRGRGQRDDLDQPHRDHAGPSLRDRDAGGAGRVPAEFVDTILGANAHVTVYTSDRIDDTGTRLSGFADYTALAATLRECGRDPRGAADQGAGDGDRRHHHPGRRGLWHRARGPGHHPPHRRRCPGDGRPCRSPRGWPWARSWRANWACRWATGFG